MMLFGAPQWLPWLWGVVGLLVVGFVAARLRRRRAAAWGDPELLARLAPGRSGFRRGLRLVAASAAVAAALVAAARPQTGARRVQVERQGIDVVVALDVSLSMEATDVVPSRLGRSQAEVRELFEGLQGNRMAVVLFSGSSFLLCPLTVDVSAANLFLDAVDADVLPDPGTDLEEALRGARRAFGDEERPRGRAILLFTDGEGHDGDPLAVARELADEGIPVITVGVGTPAGQPIPLTDERGTVSGYKKDRSGSTVLSRLDEDTLREIARVTGGRYFAATLQGRELDGIREVLDGLEKGDLGEAYRRRVEERFQVPVGIALVMLALALLTPEARRTEETA